MTIHTLAMVKDEERYVFIFDDDHIPDMIRYFGRYASDPEMESFNWQDAAILAKRVREIYSPPL